MTFLLDNDTRKPYAATLLVPSSVGDESLLSYLTMHIKGTITGCEMLEVNEKEVCDHRRATVTFKSADDRYRLATLLIPATVKEENALTYLEAYTKGVICQYEIKTKDKPTKVFKRSEEEIIAAQDKVQRESMKTQISKAESMEIEIAKEEVVQGITETDLVQPEMLHPSSHKKNIAGMFKLSGCGNAGLFIIDDTSVGSARECPSVIIPVGKAGTVSLPASTRSYLHLASIKIPAMPKAANGEVCDGPMKLSLHVLEKGRYYEVPDSYRILQHMITLSLIEKKAKFEVKGILEYSNESTSQAKIGDNVIPSTVITEPGMRRGRRVSKPNSMYMGKEYLLDQKVAWAALRGSDDLNEQEEGCIDAATGIPVTHKNSQHGNKAATHSAESRSGPTILYKKGHDTEKCAISKHDSGSDINSVDREESEISLLPVGKTEQDSGSWQTVMITDRMDGEPVPDAAVYIPPQPPADFNIPQQVLKTSENTLLQGNDRQNKTKLKNLELSVNANDMTSDALVTRLLPSSSLKTNQPGHFHLVSTKSGRQTLTRVVNDEASESLIAPEREVDSDLTGSDCQVVYRNNVVNPIILIDEGTKIMETSQKSVNLVETQSITSETTPMEYEQIAVHDEGEKVEYVSSGVSSSYLPNDSNAQIVASEDTVDEQTTSDSGQFSTAVMSMTDDMQFILTNSQHHSTDNVQYITIDADELTENDHTSDQLQSLNLENDQTVLLNR